MLLVHRITPLLERNAFLLGELLEFLVGLSMVADQRCSEILHFGTLRALLPELAHLNFHLPAHGGFFYKTLSFVTLFLFFILARCTLGCFVLVFMIRPQCGAA